MISNTALVLQAVTALVWCGPGDAFPQGEPSPASEFTLSPANVTVPEGELAILKCMTSEAAHVCRWYYLELGLNFFEKRVTPVLIKDFSPARQRDCSIRIKNVRKQQEGQWLCQALKFHSTKFIMTQPATVRVITDEESITWSPPVTQPTPPRDGRREDSVPVKFEGSEDGNIQNTHMGSAATLKCQVNQPIHRCSWVMPHGAVLTKPRDDEGNSTQQYTEHYMIEGEFGDGNCSLVVAEVRPQDEGNWRCVVRVADRDVHGPLLHLHMLEHHLPDQDGTPLVDVEKESMNVVVVGLVALCGVLLVLVVMLFTCLYRRVMMPSEETRRILKVSPSGSLEMPRKSLVAGLTSTSVMAVENMKRPPSYAELHDYNQLHEYNTLQDYSQYLDMRGANDAYIMMPGSSLRSSTSSRTTLSTLSTLPAGRDRTASNSTTISSGSPRLAHHVDNPFYNAELPETPKQRPGSVYSNDHIYEEIKEKKEVTTMDKIDEVSPEKSPKSPSPTYTNTVEDYLGYMIPKKSPSSDSLPKPHSAENQSRPPLPEASELHQHLLPVRAFTPPTTTLPAEVGGGNPETSSTGPGYSRVGHVDYNPMEVYDIPRAIPTQQLEGYDVPRRTASQATLDATPVDSPVASPDTSQDGLMGTIV